MKARRSSTVSRHMAQDAEARDGRQAVDASKRGPLPLVLGVTGHRDLRAEDVVPLERAVAKALRELQEAYRHTPLLLLSPLAAGADQLVARVAMDHRIPVVVPLPLEQAEYERDFSAAERDEFRAMLARAQAMLPSARCSYFVGYVPATADTTANDSTNVADEARRSRQYTQVGSYVARNSQILIALWNGLESDAVGGTAMIVGFKREGRTPGFGPEARPLDRPEHGPVWQIVTPRASRPEELAGGEPFARRVMWPERPDAEHGARAAGQHDDEPNDDEVARAMYRHIDQFNVDALEAGYDKEILSTETILGAAETLAKRYQMRTIWTLRWLYIAGFLVTLAFVLYAHVKHDPLLLVLDFIVSVVTLYAYFSVNNRQWQNRHQDYRAIAEGLRVQEQWHAANLTGSVADYYLRQHRGELDWIRNAIRAGRMLDDTSTVRDASPEDRRSQIRAIRETWIGGDGGQVTYFDKRSELDEKKERNVNRLTWAAALLSIACTVGAAIVFGPLQKPSGEENPWWVGVILAISLAAVASGLIGSYAEKRAYGIHVKRYRRMRGIFKRAGAMLDDIIDPAKPFGAAEYQTAQRIIHDLGEEALLENAAWVMLHRERPLEFVQGG